MGNEHWESRYHGLKAALEDAYAEAKWDSARIDAIAAELVQVERRLSSEVPGDSQQS